MNEIIKPPEAAEGGLAYSNQRLVVCEGPSDVKFVYALIKHWQPTYPELDGFVIGCAHKKQTGVAAEGKSAIPKFLVAASAHPNWRALTSVSIVIDRDKHATKRVFKEACSWLEKVKLPVPTHPNEPFGSPIRTAVLVIPANGSGTLEHLLLDAIFGKSPKLKTCVEQFAACTKSSKYWKDNKQAKMKLQTIVAAKNKVDPCASLQWVWSHKSNPIPVGSRKFYFVRDFLRSVAAP
jgi:hypothetical protein